MAATLGRAMRGDNPPVLTWGEDRRPASEKDAAWLGTADTV